MVVTGWIIRFYKWVREPIKIPDSAIPDPLWDPELTQYMSVEADQVTHEDGRLDYSVRSLDVVDQLLNEGGTSKMVDLFGFGAYLGEVIRRNATGAEWAWRSEKHRKSRQDPGIAIGKWLADPLERIDNQRRLMRKHPGSTLSAYVTQLCEYADTPTEDTIQALGWRRRSPKRSVIGDWRRWRRHHWRR
jgi:hypothetical protein